MRSKPNPYPGKLIAVEGLDGSGKSTQIYLLQKWLLSQNLKVHFTAWNSSDMVKKATRKGKKRQRFTPNTFSLIHAADFADRYEILENELATPVQVIPDVLERKHRADKLTAAEIESLHGRLYTLLTHVLGYIEQRWESP